MESTFRRVAGALLIAALFAGPPALGQPIRLHDENPHYFLFRGIPTVLVTSAEHYGAVLNPDFDHEAYLDALARDGLNYTRIFTGSYFEPPGAFGIEQNTLAPAPGRALTPWARSAAPGAGDGGAKFDLDRWDEVYFKRLRDFVEQAGERGIVVEVTLFSSIYGDEQWALNPVNPSNNLNATDPVDLRRVHTLDNGGLLQIQLRLVRRIVRELNPFDNVIFEVQNEPWADNHDLAGPINPYLSNWQTEWTNRVEYPHEAARAWQRRIVQAVRDEEAGLPNRHLIAQNYTNFRYPLFDVDPAVSVLNFHYAYPEAVRLNYGWDRAVGLDETGFAGAADSTYRRLAWNFMLAGGSLFNNLDYSFTVDHPSGDAVNRAPGGGSPALRRQLGFLKRFIERFDFVRMRPDPEIVVRAPGAFTQALGEPGRAYAVYIDGELRGDLVLDLPAGTYLVSWWDVVEGKTLSQERIEHLEGRLTLTAPTYGYDVALSVRTPER